MTLGHSSTAVSAIPSGSSRACVDRRSLAAATRFRILLETLTAPVKFPRVWRTEWVDLAGCRRAGSKVTWVSCHLSQQSSTATDGVAPSKMQRSFALWTDEAFRRKLKSFGSTLLAAALLGAGTTVAAPPAPDSEDAQIMAPYKKWIMTRGDQNGITCCEIGDGRPVDADIVTIPDNNLLKHTYWRAHVTPAHFPGQPDHWVVVPDAKIVPGANPIGTPILWLHNGLVQCFAPPDAF
jgi:hypothetical protein